MWIKSRRGRTSHSIGFMNQGNPDMTAAQEQNNLLQCGSIVWFSSVQPLYNNAQYQQLLSYPVSSHTIHASHPISAVCTPCSSCRISLLLLDFPLTGSKCLFDREFDYIPELSLTSLNSRRHSTTSVQTSDWMMKTCGGLICWKGSHLTFHFLRL